MSLLSALSLLDLPSTREWQMKCQHRFGGFRKLLGMPPDPLHACLSLCALSLMGEPGLQPLDPALAISQRAAARARANAAALANAASGNVEADA